MLKLNHKNRSFPIWAIIYFVHMASAAIENVLMSVTMLVCEIMEDHYNHTSIEALRKLLDVEEGRL